jgi:hypothetical protein
VQRKLQLLTQHRFLHAAAGALGALLLFSFPALATDYPTFHFDNARDGWNDRETVLTRQMRAA